MSNPRLDFQTNALGAFNLFEAAHEYTPEVIFLFSSTNKVYCELEYIKYFDNGIRYICPDYLIGFDEKLPLDFCLPYGCSKGAADQYVIDYGRYFSYKNQKY
jgi:CDP-paratose 2-epimerase